MPFQSSFGLNDPRNNLEIEPETEKSISELFFQSPQIFVEFPY